MEFIDVIGLVIVLLAFMVPVLRRVFEKRARAKNPEKYEQERRRIEAERQRQLRVLREMLGAEEEPEPMVVSAAPPPPLKVTEVTPQYEPIVLEEHVAYLARFRRETQIRQLLRQPHAKQEMVILHEIFSPPIALRD